MKSYQILKIRKYQKIVKYGRKDAHHVELKMENLKCVQWLLVNIQNVCQTVGNIMIVISHQINAKYGMMDAIIAC